MNREKPEPINNPQLREAIEQARENPGSESSVRLFNEVVRARLLAPVHLDRPPEFDRESGEVILEKDTEISFELISDNDDNLYYPVFTDGEEMKKCDIEEDQQSLIVNFEDLSEMLDRQGDQVMGFVINPMSDNLIFSREMVAAMKKDMAKGPVDTGEDDVQEDLDDFENKEETEE